MSTTIRLSPVGKKGERKFRLVVTTTKSKNKGKVLEVLGYLDRSSNKNQLDNKRVEYWLGVGAKKTEAVEKLLS